MACTYLMWKENEIDPRAVRKAVKGIGTDDALLIEVLCTKNKEQMDQIKSDYSSSMTHFIYLKVKSLVNTVFSIKVFQGRSLLKDVEGDTSWGLKKFLSSVIENRSSDNETVSDVQAMKDAKVNSFVSFTSFNREVWFVLYSVLT